MYIVYASLFLYIVNECIHVQYVQTIVYTGVVIIYKT